MNLDNSQTTSADLVTEGKAALEKRLHEATKDDHINVASTTQKLVGANNSPSTAMSFRRVRRCKLSNVVSEDRLKANKDFNWDEHRSIGDSITLYDRDGCDYTAGDKTFTMHNGLKLTYGHINGLAGDFYASYWPISDGSGFDEQVKNFKIAFNLLYAHPGSKPEAENILKILEEETLWIKNHSQDGEQPSKAYSTLPDATAQLEEATFCRPDGYPSYLPLSRINFDHFGQDARTSYTAGHWLALKHAASGDLDLGYMLNAFADHFLEDSFSSGHLRTPRRGLHDPDNPFSDLCAKYMHDEDCAIGLLVQTEDGKDSWTTVGDAYLRDDPAGTATLERVHNAIQISANEIHAAYMNNDVPKPVDYQALKVCPSLASATAHQKCVPLFKPSDANYRRQDIYNRTRDEFTNDWWYATTAAECWWSDKWKYPITLK